MNMQDKELDDLFRAKLEGFEAEPSARVWTGIGEELDSRKRRRVLAVLSIAASVVVLITAGILFIPKKDTTGNVNPANNTLGAIKPQPAVVKPKAEVPAAQPAVKDAQAVIKGVRPAHIPAVNSMAGVHQVNKQGVIAKDVPEPSTMVNNAAPVTPDNQTLAAIQQPDEIKQNAVTSPVVPEITTPLAVKQIPDKEQTVIKTTPAAVMANNQPKERAAPARRHGIRSIGDLVNLVVAKVDKRKDKMIEFTDSDEDESTVTAVNIGPVKIKKENGEARAER